ncbi:DUF6789 family protein [Aurantimonas sp. C2-6-R+9]|uniref:DUF6789 family protein n=1 Tax=unclassified Aurantimonas TaxID=2638230 RepID=UPI002E17C27D|nr:MULTISPECIES: DUF6789 family protein [unclassified Aurantimonas]MEC5291396.1 DUF6789 family protein [Aurantimonas sp. C2-3-R2]MEC5323790.1 DUF6789 family protein [Aurantimonas sp. A3-2-R12]MEC5381148.1 DUF6789 family protein [Aurantimonas sp. C2-6-R+9]MEC5412488.1 DUF6789 family protein [Aurantimonas sp. C2-4-R8]
MIRIGKGMAAGLVATVLLSILMVMKGTMGLMSQLDVIRMIAGMTGMSAAIAWGVHFLLGTVIWGGLFAWINLAIPGDTQWLRGIVFGIGAWLAMMVLVMPAAGQGLFGLQLGIMAPVMTLILHVIYGAVLGATYGGMVGPRVLTDG